MTSVVSLEYPAPAADLVSRRVAYVDLSAQYREERDEILRRVDDVLSSGQWLGGPAIETVEQVLADRLGVRHVVALDSGTDALILALEALGVGPGDEVITPPNSFIASAGAIAATGATPVFADVGEDQNIDPAAVEAAVTPRIRAIMPVHLTGRVAEMPAIMAIAERHGLAVVEDCAQAMGSRLNGRPAGSYGRLACFSAHPLKLLNAAGDAGWVATDDARLAERVRRGRNHGLIDRNTGLTWGRVSRMDAVQAAILLNRLARLDSVIERRRAHAARYAQRLDSRHVFIPPDRPDEFNAVHSFVVQVDRRDELQGYLAERGIETKVHYPVPLHLQPMAEPLGYRLGDLPVAERQARRILSLPVHQMLSPEDIDYVAAAINGFLA